MICVTASPTALGFGLIGTRQRRVRAMNGQPRPQPFSPSPEAVAQRAALAKEVRSTWPKGREQQDPLWQLAYAALEFAGEDLTALQTSIADAIRWHRYVRNALRRYEGSLKKLVRALPPARSSLRWMEEGHCQWACDALKLDVEETRQHALTGYTATLLTIARTGKGQFTSKGIVPVDTK